MLTKFIKKHTVDINQEVIAQIEIDVAPGKGENTTIYNVHEKTKKIFRVMDVNTIYTIYPDGAVIASWEIYIE